MTLRTKLLISYLAMLLIVLAIIVSAHTASKRWRIAADDLSRTYEQGVMAERLRWDIRQLVDFGLEFAEGDTADSRRFDQTVGRVQKLIDDLRAITRSADNRELDLDYLSGFEEAYAELLLIVGRLRKTVAGELTAAARRRLAGRLSEIEDEVDDAAAALEQYFRSRNREYLGRAEWAGRWSTVATGIAAILGSFLVLAMSYMLHRWVTRPIADLGRAADAIGAGRLDITIPRRPEGEWRKVAGALHDMTRSLTFLQQQLRTSERLSAIGEVAAYTAHNIRNPLASIRAMTQFALTQPSESPELRDTLGDIIRCVDKMEEWVSRLLGFARPLAVQLEPCHPAEIVQETMQVLQPMAAARGVTLRSESASSLPLIVGDPSLLEQAMYLIISNAIEATPRDGHVTVSIDTDGARPPEHVTLAVADTGHGIPPHLLDRVFNPFVTSKKDGTGLGLAQAKKIVDLHVGTIDIQSEENVGTRVTIRLPLKTSWSTHGTDSDR